jgi:hypothetical protein
MSLAMLSAAMLSAATPSFAMLSVAMLSVATLSVAMPWFATLRCPCLCPYYPSALGRIALAAGTFSPGWLPGRTGEQQVDHERRREPYYPAESIPRAPISEAGA